MTGSLKHEMRHMKSEQRKILNSLFESSKFSQLGSDAQPTVLDIYDFDSTLFMSPYMSSDLWSKKLNSLVLAEGAISPGWWRDLNSLRLGDTNELSKSAWDGYWNDSIVEKATQSINDPQRLTVMLTGRRFHPFGQIIPEMLKSKGLDFDIVALRPDPAETTQNGTDFSVGPSVFNNTMEFKKSFVLDVLSKVPSINTIIMYDDRKKHVMRFEEWLNYLVHKKILKHGQVHFVIGPARGFDPETEMACMQDIVDEHNKRVEIRRQDKESPPKEAEDRHAVYSWWLRKAILKPVVTSLNIRFSDEEIEKMTERVERAINSETLKSAKRFPIVGQELTLMSLEQGHNLDEIMSKDGHKVQLEVMSVGEVKPDGIAIQARTLIDPENIQGMEAQTLYIPLWCRPALKQMASDGYRELWTFDSEAPITLSGELCLGHIYDVEGDFPLDTSQNHRYYNNYNNNTNHKRGPANWIKHKFKRSKRND
ncbi:hypothetical protein NQZ79_g4052 [Umbelopsis isabellina]|nr:hypothetical protein NQZ79_g4052 [Umbelopsis isabellina]